MLKNRLRFSQERKLISFARLPCIDDLHPEMAALRKQLSDMEQLNAKLSSTSICKCETLRN
jgi:hypothetical protein